MYKPFLEKLRLPLDRASKLASSAAVYSFKTLPFSKTTKDFKLLPIRFVIITLVVMLPPASPDSSEMPRVCFSNSIEYSF